MAPRADLTGQQVAGWEILRKAPAQARVRFWTCVHEPCGIVVDLPHVTLTKAIAGKGTLPACTTCVPADERRNIDHGLHLARGQAHLLGTACPDGVRREPGPSTGRLPATVAWSLGDDDPTPNRTALSAITGISPEEIDRLGGVLEEPEPLVAPTSSFYGGHPSETLVREAEAISDELLQAIVPDSGDRATFSAYLGHLAVEPAAQLADASTGALVVHGRVDRLDEPQEILDVIRAGMHGRARNHQREPGPSQIGGCERRLGAHLAVGEGNGRRDDSAWRPEVGTAVHAWLDAMFGGQPERWLSDVAVSAPVAGRLDLFDLAEKRVIDFKLSGKSTRDKATRGEISEKYEVQLDLYGLGMLVAGYTVESVALLFLPAAGSLSEAVWYSRPFDLARALEAVARRDRIKAMLSVAPFEKVLASLSTTEDYCGSCVAFGKYCEGAAINSAPPALRMVGGAS